MIGLCWTYWSDKLLKTTNLPEQTDQQQQQSHEIDQSRHRAGPTNDPTYAQKESVIGNTSM